jgi:hypothetical protein
MEEGRREWREGEMEEGNKEEGMEGGRKEGLEGGRKKEKKEVRKDHISRYCADIARYYTLTCHIINARCQYCVCVCARACMHAAAITN